MPIGPLLIACLVVSAASACAVRPDLVKPKLAPTERLLVMRDAGSLPLPVVKNDIPAGEHFLRTKSLPVRAGDPVVDRLIERMLASVKAEKGVGIAAPQVGISRRVILVQRLDREPQKSFEAYLNPRIEHYSGETVLDWEGCLSIPAGFGQVERAESIRVSFDRPDGTPATEEIRGFTARIFQHEIDHLDGILFIDRKQPGELMEPQAYREMRRLEKEAAIDK